MGNVVPAGAAKAGPQPDFHVYLQEYPFLVYSGLLKGGKFLKSALFRSGEQGDGVIKVYRKPPPGTLAGVDVEAELKRISERLALIRGYLTLYEARTAALCLPWSCWSCFARMPAPLLLCCRVFAAGS